MPPAVRLNACSLAPRDIKGVSRTLDTGRVRAGSASESVDAFGALGSGPSSATNISTALLYRLSFIAFALPSLQSARWTADCIQRPHRLDHAQLSARQERR